MKRRRWVLWLLLPVGLVFGNCQVIPESRSPETLITTPIPTLALTLTTTSIPQAPTITSVPTQAPTSTTSTLEAPITALIPTPAPIPMDAASGAELDLTSVIGSILSNPADYAGREVTILGYYRGWDLLGEAGSGPPVTRSDWVIMDANGVVYVSGRGGFDRALGLDPASRDSVTTVLHLVGTVRVTTGGQPYIEAKRVTQSDAEGQTAPLVIPQRGEVGADSIETVPPVTMTVATALIDEQEIERPSRGNPKLGSSLNQLLEAYHRGGLAEAQAFATMHMMVLDDNRVQVEMVTSTEAMSDLIAAIEAVGGEYQGHYEAMMQALVPMDALESLAQRPDVQTIREPRRAVVP